MEFIDYGGFHDRHSPRALLLRLYMSRRPVSMREPMFGHMQPFVEEKRS